MPHDIIDNRQSKLVDHINRILGSTSSAKFAVGYFFLSGLESIAKKLEHVEELRLLIGNTTNRETLEQMVEGYRRLEMVQDVAEEQKYVQRVKSRQIAENTAANVRSAMELMDQTDEGEALIGILARLIEEDRLRVKVYTKGRLHAKAYIFDYKNDGRYEEGIAVVGSSNLTLAGVTHNTELNVVVHGKDNHQALSKWFEELWEEAEEFDESLMSEMKQSWALADVRPYDIYLKTLYTLVRDRLEGEDERDILWTDEITDALADFQKNAVRLTVQNIRNYGGAFVSDVVGLGKSFVGAAVVKHFQRTEHARPLIICPAPLQEMWELYNERYELNARVLSIGMLRESDDDINVLLSDVKYKDRDFVLVDESHNFRNSEAQRYRILQGFLSTGRKSCFLTATPRNKSVWDVYWQLKLFHQEETTYLPIDPPELREFFKLIEKQERKLPDLLTHILVRRRRNDVVKWYGFDSETHQRVDPTRFDEYVSGKRRAYVVVAGKHQFFPRRKLETIEYSIEDTYQGLYQQIRKHLGKARKGVPKEPIPGELMYARYGLWHYVLKDKQKSEPYTSLQRAGSNLRGLIRILLFKRFESSVEAFRQTLRKILAAHRAFVASLNDGFVPAGEDAQRILYESDDYEEQYLLDELRRVSGRYDANDFDLFLLHEHIVHDIEVLDQLLSLVQDITPKKDAKLQCLLGQLKKTPLDSGKRLIFTQFADTARYLYNNINPGDRHEDIDVIYSGDKSKARIAARFAPKANPDLRGKGGPELNTVIATDVLAEGLNLQDCDKVVNYDLHWNPVKLIQRFGRIDRIGSEHDTIHAFNFLPEVGLEKNLGLREKLSSRIQEIQDTIGEDSAILDPSEKLNQEAMYAIYENNGGQISLFEIEDDEMIDLNDAEEFLRQIRQENPEEYQRISNLRDGIRTAMKAPDYKCTFVFCQSGTFQQLFLADNSGNITSRDLQRALSTIKCAPDQKAAKRPMNHNSIVMKVKRIFVEEVKSRNVTLHHSLSLSHGQKYVLRELRTFFAQDIDEDLRGQINILDESFRNPVTSAIKKELNILRRNNVSGEALVRALSNIYHQHNVASLRTRGQQPNGAEFAPKVVCSEALI